jgi:hypothetical protein
MLKRCEEATDLCQHCAAALAVLLLRRRKRKRVGLTNAASSANSTESRKGVPSLDGEVDPSEFVFCRNADGSEVCLGEGNFGKARAPDHACAFDSPCRVHMSDMFTPVRLWNNRKRALR